MSCVIASFLPVENRTSSKKVLCERLDTDEHGWACEAGRLHESGYKQQRSKPKV